MLQNPWVTGIIGALLLASFMPDKASNASEKPPHDAISEPTTSGDGRD